MPTSHFMPTFAGGVIGPGLHGRVDLAKYDTALRVGRNVFVHAFGGVSNRAGTEFIAEVSDSTKFHRLIPFRRATDTAGVIVLGDQNMRYVRNGGYAGIPAQIATPWPSSDLKALDYVQSIDVLFMVHPLHAPRKLNHMGDTNWTITTAQFAPQTPVPTGLAVTARRTGEESYWYTVTAVINGVESYPAPAVQVTLAELLGKEGARNTITWAAVAGASEYRVYRGRNGVYGYIGFSQLTSFTDDNIDADITVTPPQVTTIFSGAGSYPSVVTLFQQRLIFAATINQPETVWMSRVGEYENFTRSKVVQASDRVQFDLAGEQINQVRSLLQLRELLVFASGGEFAVGGPDGGITALNPVVTQYGYTGASSVKPLVVEDTALFVDRTEQNVRDLRYAFEQDGYAGNDLTIFASHFFAGRRVAGWAYARSPHSIIWVYMDDGKLLSFTYKREHQVWAWCEHDVGGAVESMASIPEGLNDALYMIVRRTINGTTRRYIERMHNRQFAVPSRAWFVDCGKNYTGSPVSTVTGLAHLDGMQVVALADGNVVTGLTVSGGSVTLPRPASIVTVGLPYVSEIETLPPAVELQDVGNARGRPHTINRVRLQVQATRGIKVNANRDRWTEIVQTGGNLADPIGMFTGMLEVEVHPSWSREGVIGIRQDYPLPFTILGISPEMGIGRS